MGTGSTPGWARQTGQVWTLGSSPKESSQPQNIFVRVESWTWISSPITASSSAIAHPLRPGVEPDRLLQREGGLQQLLLGEGGGGDLEADRELRAAPAGSARPAGIEIAGMPARLIGTVKKSLRYIASGSSVFSPRPKATEGEVGVTTKSNLGEGGGEVLGDLGADLLRLAVVGVVVAGGERVGAEHDAPLDLGPKPSARVVSYISTRSPAASARIP